MDLNLLMVFEAVYREQNLTQAADTLSVTPSAVSHALRRLRDHLGDPLFERRGRRMVPTAVCARNAPALLDELAALRRLLQQWGTFEPSTSEQPFRIGMPEAVEMAFMPSLQTRMLRDAPSITLSSVSFDRGQLAHLLSAGRLDAAIDVVMPMREPVKQEPLFEDGFSVVARPDHPLRRAPTIRQYLAASHVAVSRRPTGLVLEDRALIELSLQRRVAVRCQTYASALSIVAASDHLLTVPSRLGRNIPGFTRMRRWKPPFELPKAQLHLYWHTKHDTDPASTWLRRCIVDAMRPR